MKPKYVVIALSMGLFLISVAATPALAGGKSHHRLEGFVLGFGTAVIGNMLLDHHHVRVHAHGRGYGGGHRWKGHHGRRHHPRHHRYRHHHGHWEWQRVWVPPVYKKVWKPKRRHHRGRHHRGHWVEVPVSRGYWKKERVWVSRR